MYLEVSDVKKSYGEGGSYIQVLKGVSLQVKQGDMCVIQGTSGSGKSTLLNCIGGLDTIESGSIKVDGTEIAGIKQMNYPITGEIIWDLSSSSIIWYQTLPCGKIYRSVNI